MCVCVKKVLKLILTSEVEALFLVNLYRCVSVCNIRIVSTETISRLDRLACIFVGIEHRKYSQRYDKLFYVNT